MERNEARNEAEMAGSPQMAALELFGYTEISLVSPSGA
jgi:hypothetical protein